MDSIVAILPGRTRICPSGSQMTSAGTAPRAGSRRPKSLKRSGNETAQTYQTGIDRCVTLATPRGMLNSRNLLRQSLWREYEA